MKYLPITILLLTVGLFHACDLDEYNPSGVTAETVFSTPEGFETLVNACYVNLRKEFYGTEDILLMTEGGTDCWFNNEKSFYNKQTTRYMNLASDLTKFNNPWKRMYDPINLCNAAIGRADGAGFPNDSIRDAKVAEAHFLRAYYNWMIVEQWGGVILRTEETAGPVLSAQRSSVDDFYEVILDDIDFAVSHLPMSQVEIGRPDKKAALALQARLALTRAAYFDPTTPEAVTYYTLAKTAATELITNKAMYGVDLYPDFSDVFKPANNKANTECLFKVTHSATSSYNGDDTPNRLHLWFLSDYSSYCGVSLNLADGNDQSNSRGPGLMPTLYQLDVFNEDMDARYYASFQEAFFCNYVMDPTSPIKIDKKRWTTSEITRFKKDNTVIKTTTTINTGDTALFFTKKGIADKARRNYGVVDKYDLYDVGNTDSILTTELNAHHPQLRKYLDPNRSNVNFDFCTQDVILIRLAEMYLIAAEAEYYLNNKPQAKDWINVLRTRAAIKAPVNMTDSMQVTENDLSPAFFLDERARELTGEHLRWFDLVRTFRRTPTAWVEWIKAKNPNILDVKTHHMYRPIPQIEVETMLNFDAFGQNPGYDTEN